MDNDDNDFQSQDPHLAGEGSAQFSPALRPYSLTKFDFDESLQGNLRFDNLVETEVFLGIGSGEGNQWIEDFSQGSSGIEFSSGAAQSCSISRRNNVWYDVTSSESVEMLLKSVGQEELVPRQSSNEGADARDELAYLARQMEHDSEYDGSVICKTEDAIELLHPGGTLDNDPVLKEGVGRELSQGEISQHLEIKLSVDGNSSNEEPSDIGKRNILHAYEASLSSDGKCDSANQRKAKASINDSDDNTLLEGSSTSKIKSQDTLISVMNICSGCEASSDQNVQHRVIGTGDEIQDSFVMETAKQEKESHSVKIDVDPDIQHLDGNEFGGDACHLNNPVCSWSKPELLEVGNAVGAGLSNVEESPSMLSRVDKELHDSEMGRGGICSKNPVGNTTTGDMITLEDAAICDPGKSNTCERSNVAIVDTNIDEQVADVRTINSRVRLNVETHIDPALQETNSMSSKEEVLLNSSSLLDSKTSGNHSEARILLVNDDIISMGNERNINGLIEDADKGSNPSIGGPISTKTDSGDSEIFMVNDSGPISENTKLASSQSVEVPMASENDETADEVRESKDVGIAPVVGSSDINKMEQIRSKSSMEEGIYPSIGTFEEKTDSNPAYEIHNSQSCETSGQLLCVRIDHSLRTTVHTKQESTLAADVIKDSAQETDVSPIPCESAKKLQVEAVVLSEKRKVATVEKTYDKASSETDISVVHLHERNGETLSVTLSFPMEELYSVQTGPKEKDTTFASQDQIAAPKTKVDASKGCEVFLCSSPLPNSRTVLLEPRNTPICPDKCAFSNTIEISSEMEKDRKTTDGGSTDENASVPKVIDVDATNDCSISRDPKGNDTSKDDKSFTFEVKPVADLSPKDVSRMWHTVPATTFGKASPTVEGSPSASGLDQREPKTSANTTLERPCAPGGAVPHGTSKVTPERKTRRAAGKAAGKGSTRKSNHAKEPTPVRQPAERGERPSNVSPNSSTIFPHIQSNEMQRYGHVDRSTVEQCSFLKASTSSLPDLNTSASPSVLFQQPFTDLLQVQLRAQILVYGALIQGTAPDEAHMFSAFGGPDGGRSSWENSWHACIQRLKSQKSYRNNPETPLQSQCPGATDTPVKKSSAQGIGTGRANGNGTPTIVNPLLPLSTPLWSLPTPCDSLQSSALERGSVMDHQQPLTPLHSYQSPIRNFPGHAMSWISQAPIIDPWIASPQTPAPNHNILFSASPVADTVKLNSVKGLSLPLSSGMKNVNHGSSVSCGGPPGIHMATAPVLDSNNVTATCAHHTSDIKPRKRKKTPATKDFSQNVLQSQSQPQPDLAFASPAISHPSISATISIPMGNVSKSIVEKPVVPVSHISSSDHLKRINQEVEKRALSEDSLDKVKEATVHAEEAAALSAAAVHHCQEIWVQLDKQKNCRLVSEVEAKLASAAVAISAAAAVAKAAAAVARVASNAALQAKLMADEVVTSCNHENLVQNNASFVSDSANKVGEATPASILKGANGANSSSSIIFAAKEAARRRVEAASAATKQAENMDAIVKAAELAAEAVSQAGKLVATGDPLPLSHLIESGPEGCLITSPLSSEPITKSKDLTRGKLHIDNLRDVSGASHKPDDGGPSDQMEIRNTTHETSNHLQEIHNEILDDNIRLVDGISGSITVNEESSSGGKGFRVSNSSKIIGVAPKSEIGLQSSSTTTLESGYKKLDVDNIKEGSHIEILKIGGRFKAAWFSANVLSLKGGNAYVGYTELQTDDGLSQLKEWIKIESESDKQPMIRFARPVTGLSYEGTRKRNRAATLDYAWSVGDRVDAWMHGSWWEGVVTEKKKKDETTVTVHFQAQGETSVVRAWHLRPSLIWRDGKWIEWSILGENDSSSHEGDTPAEKRCKRGSPAVEVKGDDKMPKSIGVTEPVNPDESRSLDLTHSQKVFNIGKDTKNDDNPNAPRATRTGLWKEGSKVIFGVPKPGKKRKYMEVSKHYVADTNSKVNDGKESVKFKSHLICQGSRSCKWRNTTKNEAKEKRATEAKPETVKAGRPPNVSGRSFPKKDNHDDLSDHAGKIQDSLSNVKKVSGDYSQIEIGSYSNSEGTSEGPFACSSLGTSVDVTSKKISSSSAKFERENKGKLAPVGNLPKKEEEKASRVNSVKLASEVIEPRRSNRRIQPTSRLLEGLQSSLIISKIPSVSHDKGHKSQQKLVQGKKQWQ